MKEALSPQLKAGRALRRLIEENFSSQEEFAYQYYVDVRTISRYINNGINKIDVIQDLAEKFDVPFEYFFQDH